MLEKDQHQQSQKKAGPDPANDAKIMEALKKDCIGEDTRQELFFRSLKVLDESGQYQGNTVGLLHVVSKTVDAHIRMRLKAMTEERAKKILSLLKKNRPITRYANAFEKQFGRPPNEEEKKEIEKYAGHYWREIQPLSSVLAAIDEEETSFSISNGIKQDEDSFTDIIKAETKNTAQPVQVTNANKPATFKLIDEPIQQPAGSATSRKENAALAKAFQDATSETEDSKKKKGWGLGSLFGRKKKGKK